MNCSRLAIEPFVKEFFKTCDTLCNLLSHTRPQRGHTKSIFPHITLSERLDCFFLFNPQNYWNIAMKKHIRKWIEFFFSTRLSIEGLKITSWKTYDVCRNNFILCTYWENVLKLYIKHTQIRKNSLLVTNKSLILWLDTKTWCFHFPSLHTNMFLFFYLTLEKKGSHVKWS